MSNDVFSISEVGYRSGRAADDGPSTVEGRPQCRARVLVVVEGVQDVEYLRRFSDIYSESDSLVPNIAEMEAEGRVVFAPIGGGRLSGWTHRFESLGLAEFHLYDREAPPVTAERLAAATAVNRRPGCVAAVTAKRGMENYLHPEAIAETVGIALDFSEEDDVAGRLVDELFPCYRQTLEGNGDRRSQRKKLRDRLKKVLCTRAAEKMTLARLAQSDPDREVLGWLATIGRLALARE